LWELYDTLRGTMRGKFRFLNVTVGGAYICYSTLHRWSAPSLNSAMILTIQDIPCTLRPAARVQELEPWCVVAFIFLRNYAKVIFKRNHQTIRQEKIKQVNTFNLTVTLVLNLPLCVIIARERHLPNFLWLIVDPICSDTQRDNKLKSMWKEAFVAYSEVPSGKFT
jgi:hypothetical protein